MPDAKTHRSGRLDVEAGAKVVKGFLEGFDALVSLPAVETQLKLMRTFSLSFTDVRRAWVTGAEMGGVLHDESLDLKNSLLKGYLDQGKSTFYLVDSVIASRDFTVTRSRRTSGKLTVTIAEIEKVLKAKGSVSVSETTGEGMSFRRPTYLPFAFTCYRAELGALGMSMRLQRYVGANAFILTPSRPEPHPLRNAILTDEAGLLDWDS